MSELEYMTVKEFDKLSKRDFENGATTDAIRRALKALTLYSERDKKMREALEWACAYIKNAHIGHCGQICDSCPIKQAKEGNNV